MFGQWKNFLKSRVSILPLVLFFTFTKCYATTAVFMISPQGIVAGTDQLTTEISTTGALKSRSSDIPKLELVKQRFIVASIGVERMGRDSFVAYSFSDWIKALGDKLGADASVSEFVRLIKDEAARTFRDRLGVERQMQGGTFKKSQAVQCNFVEYIVGGYEAGIPTIVSIYLQLDWYDNRLIGPIEEVQFPTPGFNPNVGFYASGVKGALDDFTNIDSYPYKRFLARRPVILKKIAALNELTALEATDTIRLLISIQAEITPSEVGRSTSIAVVPVKGVGSVTDYPDIRVLPQSERSRKKQTKKRRR